ncbi:DNA dC-_dU-editing enzyme APOBEC3 [Camelus dromedarius]|uniref:single-stranded DNA cytosine deaminase n=1 Tax=Camelus dromedarius TaxID=9838 RepID=A0A5N4DEQ0_CAMDR|nr:DNA dC->dU-editing enzyme APOBEC3 [Camelus dromedarius]
MEASTAPRARCLMDEHTFTHNFSNHKRTHKTYLCYEVEILHGDSGIPPDEDKGFLCNKGTDQPGLPCHVELYLLGRIRSWKLDRKLHCRLTCFISWTPCGTCARELAEFLKENSHVSLCIFASRIYSLNDYEAGLRTLQEAGAQIAIMTFKEFRHCWETFVDHQGRPFQPWDELDINSQGLSKELQAILQTHFPMKIFLEFLSQQEGVRGACGTIISQLFCIWRCPGSGEELEPIHRLRGTQPQTKVLATILPQIWQRGDNKDGNPSHGVPLTAPYDSGQRWPMSNPVERIVPQTFSFHFKNLMFASGRNCTYLCYQVKRKEHCSPVFPDKGVFQNEVNTPCHAELCFLSWFNKRLSPDECYHVTWFMSWSPCFACTEQVAKFLEKNRNVRLSIFAARLYYFWQPAVQQGLRRLHGVGACVGIMSYQDFKYCWENFVYNQRMPFKPWEKQCENSKILVTKLEEILRNTMSLLKEDIFNKQFGNQPRVTAPYYRRKTYLCYQLKGPNGSILAQGCVRNKKQRHAEIRFIDKINFMNLDPNQSYEIICYVTWSPCPTCAEKLVDLINDQVHLKLQIFASRLYFHWVRKYQIGLQYLWASQVTVAVMNRREFKDCWEKFVDNQGKDFQGWYKLEEYNRSISRRLNRILMQPLKQNNLEDSFRDLRLGSPSPSSRSYSR